jgi:hypothetical protein
VFWPVSSSYNALNARLQRRFSHGLLAQASYTWSKSLDSGSNSLPTAYSNTVSNLPYFDSRLRRSVSDFDVPQLFVVSGTWELPAVKRPSNAAAWLLSGWQLGTLLQLNSGLPFTPTIAGDPLGLDSVQRSAMRWRSRFCGTLSQICYMEPSFSCLSRTNLAGAYQSGRRSLAATMLSPSKRRWSNGGKAEKRHFERGLRRLREPARCRGTSPPPDLARFIATVMAGLTVQAVNGATRDEMKRIADLVLKSIGLA